MDGLFFAWCVLWGYLSEKQETSEYCLSSALLRTMSRISVIFMIAFTLASISARSCFIGEKKDTPEIHVIHLPDRNRNKEMPEILALDIPDDKRKRDIRNAEKPPSCKSDQDCMPDERCFGQIQCVTRNQESITVHKKEELHGIIS
ncbi:uncharacterized protein [Prorops nasuta]|uniref:uncharacterized protein n=1 Tax=Prorops nasuta TaxID=863751 RepID=UPI0034CFB45D